MAELMLVNPRKRRARKKKRTPAQRAATRRLVAANKRRASPRRAPVKRRRAAPVRRRAALPVARRVRRYKRNPNGRGIINTTLMPAATAATGALALDVLWGFVPIPEGLKSGPLRHVVKGAGAIGMGWLAGQVVKKSTAAQFATGALTVIMHDAMRDMMARFMPGVGLGYYSAGMPAGTMGEYVGGGMGAYVQGDPDPYQSGNMLATPFAGPSAADMAYTEGVTAGAATTETENNMGGYYNY